MSFELSELDRRILELNHQGLPMREISESLQTLYSIKLSKSSVIRHLRELRQDPDNGVQIKKSPIPRPPREQNKWYKIIEQLQKQIIEYTKLFGFKPTSRTMFYQFLDEKLVESHEHHGFSTATVEARLGWVDTDGKLYYPKLDIDCFADDQRKIANYFDNTHPIPPGEPGPIEDPDDYINRKITSLKQAPEDYDGVGTSGSLGQRGGRWYGQHEYVAVWEEKNDLLEGFEKLLDGKSVDIKANKGYPSLAFLNNCCVELKEVIDLGYDPEHIHVKYCGDWDPSGENIDYYIKRRLKQLGIEGIDFERIAVTPEQIKKYNLPLMSIRKRPGKKAPNPNMNEFKRRLGEAATHLNAFFIKKRIKDFKKILDKAVDKHFDPSIHRDEVEEYKILPDAPERYSATKLERIHQMMYRKITEEFKEGWERGGTQ